VVTDKDKGNNNFLSKCIANIIFIIGLYLPSNMYIMKFVIVIIFTILYWKNQLKKLFMKHQKDDTSKK
jgi:hypothetical protein